ncbi:glucosaminidase domain-containing protein [Candidatus Gottesmanbacteria bacterium]|nr:glucosaminidase domain-containing protein [Candidatus Gottesmanbacteria bacterium]
MGKKFLLVATWYTVTLGFLGIVLANASIDKKLEKAGYTYSKDPALSQSILASAGSTQILGTSIVSGDARSALLEAFLKNHDSPMAPFADLLVHEADANGIDYRMVVSIAMCESNLGKRIPTKDSFNAWGIAVYTGQQSGAKFTDWQSAISWVSKFIKTKFYDRGITDLKDIGAIWAPPSVEAGYSWSSCVNTFMKAIQ